MDDSANAKKASASSDWRCRSCSGAPDHAQDFACAACGWPWSACQECGNPVALFRDEPGQEDRCEVCGPSETATISRADDQLGQKILAVLTGLGDGARAMKTKSGVPWERFSVIQAAWRAAGSPHRGDPGWNAWQWEREELRRQLGSKRAFGRPTLPAPEDPE
jgi:hypothetical protein